MKTNTIALGAIVILVVAGFWMNYANASRYNNDTTNITNNYPAPMTITEGVSKKDLAMSMAMSMASGGHQFDYSYTGLQGSVVWATQIDEDKRNAYSGALGYNFIDKLDLKVLGTVTFTPEQQEDLGDWMIFHGTFRF